jgi:hypothetical protein
VGVSDEWLEVLAESLCKARKCEVLWQPARLDVSLRDATFMALDINIVYGCEVLCNSLRDMKHE